ncbi:MAG: hypothetical protein WA055_02500 [Candidatus Moraniibacteriota bacterium]
MKINKKNATGALIITNENKDELNKKHFNFFKKIHNEFAKTKYGKKLEKEIRYGRYKPKAVSKKIWQEVLGPDVNNLRHHLVMYDIVNNFFKYNDQGTSGEYIFDYNERKLLIIASLIHDWGESVTGDISADLKNGKNEKKEFEAAKKIINEFTFKYNDLISKNNLQEAFDNVVIGKNEKLSRAFNAIERIGYLLIGIKAWEEGSNFYKDNNQFTKNLWWLTTNVFLNQIKELVKYSDKYPAVKFYLDKNKKKIDNIFAKMPEEIFLKYKKERAEKKKQFEEAKKVWVSSRDKIRY